MHRGLAALILHVQGRTVLVEPLDHLEMATGAGNMHRSPAALTPCIDWNTTLAAKPAHFVKVPSLHRGKQKTQLSEARGRLPLSSL